MKFLWKNKGIALIFLLGLIVFLYPTVSNYWNEYRASRLMDHYTEGYEELSDDSRQEMLRAAEEYNKTLIGQEVPDAFAKREDKKNKEYENLLSTDDSGVMGSIEIPGIDVSLPIFHYTDEDVLEKGAGHLFGSSLPVGGESTHAVISAHRGLPSAKLFTDLNLLTKGDLFYIKVLGNTLAYEVSSVEEVEPSDTQSLRIVEGEDLVTLVTCTPYGVNSRRLLVHGHRVDYNKEEIQKTKVKTDTTRLSMQLLYTIAGMALPVGGYLIYRFLRKKRVK